MKPIIKYQGGKSRELPIIRELTPEKFNRVIEPFCGGAAVSLDYEKPSVLNDLNSAVINLYRVISGSDYYKLQSKIDEIKTFEHDNLSEEYYKSRDIINSPKTHTSLEWAIAYVVVRQLCFSGMERYNSKGDFNVPFGHYKKMSCNLSLKHHNFFKNKVTLSNDDAISIIKDCNEDDWIFVDPPYLDRLGYTNGDGGDKLHENLVSALQSTKSKWLFIHSDCEFYRDSFSRFNILTKDFKYGQNFGKGKDHSKSKVQHIYVTNYSVEKNKKKYNTGFISRIYNNVIAF
tara:strand:- start:40 stop:903 length:864 start_codon:yes stop_codon:yes gene_type:complete